MKMFFYNLGVFLAVLAMAGACSTRRSVLDDLVSSRKNVSDRWMSEVRDRNKPGASAQGELSLQDAIRLSMSQNQALQSVVQEREIARGKVFESYAAALPAVSASGNYTRLDEVASIDVAGQKVSLGLVDNYSAGLTVTQPIIHGVAIPAAMRAARFYALFTDEKLRGMVELTVFQVARSYFDALLANHLLDVKKEAVALAERYLNDVRRKKEQGMASEYNVLRAQVEVSNARAELINSRNAEHLAMTGLFRAIGISQESEVELIDKLSYQSVSQGLELALRFASENRPDLYQSEIAVRMQREALRIAQSAFWPRVDAFFSQEWARPAPRSMASEDWGGGWTAGIAVNLPVFDGFTRYGRLVQEKARLRQAEINLTDVEGQVFLEVKQAIFNIIDAESFLDSQRMNLKHAMEGFRLMEVGYREGVHSEVEVMDGQMALTRAQTLYYQAVHAHTMARLFLQKATGLLAPELGMRAVPDDPKDPQDELFFDELTRNVGVD